MSAERRENSILRSVKKLLTYADSKIETVVNSGKELVLKRNGMLHFWFRRSVFLAVGTSFLAACAQRTGDFFYGALGLGSPKIVVASQNTGTGVAMNVVLYDLNGRLISVLADYTGANDIPKGIAPYDAFSFAVLLDGVDRIARSAIDGTSRSDLTTNSNLTGTLYNLTYDSFSQRYYASEGNTSEAFDRAGNRLGNPYLGTTISSCVQATTRGLFATDDGRLFAVGDGNDDLLVYDVTSASSATCIRANTAFAGTVNPWAVMVHSNGSVYVAAQGDDRIYTFDNDGTGSGTVLWATNTAVINNPTALLELPDGSILVASDGTNSIERIGADGTLIGSASFIRDGFTDQVNQMMLIGGE